MSAVNVIAAIVLVGMLGGLAVAWWQGRQQLFSCLFVAAILVLAAAMTIGRLNEEQNPVTAARTPPPAAAPTGSSTPPFAVGFDAGEP